MRLSSKALIEIIKQKWLKNDGICIVETAQDETLDIPAEMQLIENRRYGIAMFWFLELKI